MKEKYIRYGALTFTLVAVIFSETVRDNVLWICSMIVFIWAVALLAACVVVPEEVAKWWEDKGWWPFR